MVHGRLSTSRLLDDAAPGPRRFGCRKPSERDIIKAGFKVKELYFDVCDRREKKLTSSKA